MGSHLRRLGTRRWRSDSVHVGDDWGRDGSFRREGRTRPMERFLEPERRNDLVGCHRHCRRTQIEIWEHPLWAIAHIVPQGARLGLRRGWLVTRCNLFEDELVVGTIIVVPPFTNTRGLVACGEKDGPLGQFSLHVLQSYQKRKTVPSKRWHARRGTIGREGGRKRREGAHIFAHNLARRLPVVESETQCHRLFKCDILDKYRASKRWRSCAGKHEGLDVDVCECRWLLGGNGGRQRAVNLDSKLIGVDGRKIAATGKHRSVRRRIVSLGLCLRIIGIAAHSAWPCSLFKHDYAF